jgi:hypothetical protein
MAGIVLAVTAQVMVIQFVVMALVMAMKPMKHVQMIVMHLVNVMLVILLTALMTIAAQSLGLVMVLKTVKIRLLAVI